MLLSAIFLSLVAGDGHMAECTPLPGMVALDQQVVECCSQASALIAKGAMDKGMGAMVPQCYTECTDDGKTPTEAAQGVAAYTVCCVDVGGQTCGASILAGGNTGGGSMNAMVMGAFDEDQDGVMDMCSELNCEEIAAAAAAGATEEASEASEASEAAESCHSCSAPPTNCEELATAVAGCAAGCVVDGVV